jgi:hypothetical protein
VKQKPTKIKKTVQLEEPMFQLGAIRLTPNASSLLTRQEIEKALDRHERGDCGEMSGEERKHNDNAAKSGGRILSEYESGSGVKFWVLTEGDRSKTTVLLRHEYRCVLFLEEDSICKDKSTGDK